jgi:nitroreductase
MFEFLTERSSIREYSDKPVDKALINKLLQVASQASNTGNMQTYSVVVTTDTQLKEQLSPTHFNQKMLKNAAAILTFNADFNRFSKWCKLSDAEPGYDNFQSFMAAAIDAIIFAQTFAIAAERAGLGICYLGTTTYNASEIIDILQLPSLVVPVTSITVGYPATAIEKTDRLPLEAIVHNETYKDYTSDAIKELYAEKENSEFYKNFVAENNKETLAQVFTDIRYSKKNNEFFSEKFLEVLKRQGFME